MRPPPPEAGLDELLRPSLGPADDATQYAGQKAPWDPGDLLYPAFFGGFLAAAPLFALNFTRLGRPRLAWPCGLLLGLLGVLCSPLLVLPGYAVPSRLVVLLVCWLPCVLQTHRFRVYERNGGEAAPLLRVGCLAILGAFAVSAICLVVLLLLWPE